MSSLSERVRRGSRLGVLFLLLAPFLAGVSAFAQLPTGTFLGTVKDSSGALVPGANVTARNEETGTSRSIATDSSGEYRLTALPPGHYDLTVDASGFNTATQTGVVLDVSSQVTLNFDLQVGTTTQKVVVSGEAPLVDTTSASLGGLVSEQKIEDLPLNGRNFLDLALQQPGIAQDTVLVNSGGGTQGTVFSSNGAPIISNNFLLDGTPTQNVFGFNGASAVGSSLGLDGIREYRVITSNFSAEYGMRMGSQTTIVSKGGTDQFHGDLFEYLRNGGLDARNFFTTQQEVCPNATTYSSACRNPEYQRNNFGAAFGGPIQKDKTFFWAVYEGLRQVQGNPVITTSPSTSPATSGCWAAAVTGTVNNATQCAGLPSYPYTVPSAVLPLLQLFDPADSQYIQLSKENVNYGQIRVDHTFSMKDSAFVRYTIEDSNEYVPGPGFGTTPNGYKEFEDYETSRDQYITVSESHIFSPAVLNAARISLSRTSLPTFIVANPSSGDPALGVPSVPVNGANVSFNAGNPLGLVALGNGLSTFGNAFTPLGPDPFSPNFHLQNWSSVSDDVFWTRGKHAFKFGFLGNRIQIIDTEGGGTLGAVYFSTPSGGNPLDYMIENGVNQETATIPGGVNHRDYRMYTLGFYGQDDWRATSRLTLNLGLRYEFNTTVNESSGLQTTVLNPTATVSCAGWVAGQCSPDWTNPLSFQPFVGNPSLKNFSPRLGFAYDPKGDGKTSIRGGFGIYYDVATPGLATFPYTNGDAPYHGTYTVSTAGFAGPGMHFAPGFVSNSGIWSYPYVLTNSAYTSSYFSINPLGAYPGATAAFGGFNYNSNFAVPTHNISQPYTDQWTLTVDRELPGGMALAISYVGSQAHHLWNEQDLNPCQPTGSINGVPDWINSANANCPSANLMFPASHSCTYYLYNGASYTQVVKTDGRANCNYKIYAAAQTNGMAWYNGLQVVLQKRVSHGLQFQSSYTYSQNLDTMQGQGSIDAEVNTPATPVTFDKGKDPLNATHNWRFNTLYNLPTKAQSQGFVSKVVNGWSVQNIVALQTGFAFTPVAPTYVGPGIDAALSGDAGSFYERPVYVTSAIQAAINCPLGSLSTVPGYAGMMCNPNAAVYNPKTVIVGQPTEWFNYNMFTTAPWGQLGNVSRGILNGPSLIDWDFSVHKDTKVGFLGEAGSLQFRAEFFNILNHTNFLNNPAGSQNNGIVPPGVPQTSILVTPGTTPATLTQALSGRDIQFALRLVF